MGEELGYPLDIQVRNDKAIIFFKLKGKEKTVRIERAFFPEIYFLPFEKTKLRLYLRALEEHPFVVSASIDQKRADVKENRIREVIKIKALGEKGKKQLIKDLSPHGRLFNIDLDKVQQFVIQNGFFPGLMTVKSLKNTERKHELDYYIPSFSQAWLSITTENPHKLVFPQERLKKACLTFNDGERVVLEGEEEQILLGITETLKTKDPDILFTSFGDNKVIPYLFHRARIAGVGDVFDLGREKKGSFLNRYGRGISLVSYGMSYYKAFPTYLSGRVHIDTRNSFFFKDSGIPGLVEISRLSSYPLQKVSRMSIGKAFTGVEIVTAFENGILIPPEKATPEIIKPASYLLKADNGGMIFTPKPGIYQGVVEVDFTSFYPHIMKNYNISSETVLCSCCAPGEEGVRIVPYINYHVCGKKRGIVPLALEELLRRRMIYKKMKKEVKDSEKRKLLSQKDATIKWMLVTCFGYLGFRHARWGSIESHQAVTAYGRKLLFDASKIFEKHGWEVVAGIVDSLWVRKKGINLTAKELVEDKDFEKEFLGIINEIESHVNVPLELDGVLDWIVFLPLKQEKEIGALTRYYGKFTDGELKIRGVELRRKDAPIFIKKFQTQIFSILKEASNTKEFVAQIPKTKKILFEWREKIWKKEVPVNELIITKRLGKENYEVNNHQAIAKKQLEKLGVKVSRGEKVSFLVVNNRSKNPDKRILVTQLLTENMPYDPYFYDKYLQDAYHSILGFIS